MNNELRNVVKKVVPLADDHFIDNATKLFMDWHIHQRKNWALELLPKEKCQKKDTTKIGLKIDGGYATKLSHGAKAIRFYIRGYNENIAEMRKRIKG